MSLDEMLKDSNWVSAIATIFAAGAALVSAFMAYISFINAERLRKSSIAVTLSPHFHNIQDLIVYLRNWRGFSQDILNQKRESVSILRNFLCDDHELLKILDKIDPWPNKQIVLTHEEKQLETIIKKYLQMDK